MPAINAARAPGVLARSITDTAQMLSLSRAQIYRLFEKGQLAYLKIGKRRLVESAEIERFLAAHRRRAVTP